MTSFPSHSLSLNKQGYLCVSVENCEEFLPSLSFPSFFLSLFPVSYRSCYSLFRAEVAADDDRCPLMFCQTAVPDDDDGFRSALSFHSHGKEGSLLLHLEHFTPLLSLLPFFEKRLTRVTTLPLEIQEENVE